MGRFHRVTEADDGWSIWQEPILSPSVYRMACCDCGLVHDLEFTIGKSEDGITDRVHFRARRNPRSTGQMRRRTKQH